jgi:hypothetical protein
MDRNNVIPDHQSFEPCSRAQSKTKGKQSHSGRRNPNELLALPEKKKLKPNRIVCFIVMFVEHLFPLHPLFYVLMTLAMMSFRFVAVLFLNQFSN